MVHALVAEHTAPRSRTDREALTLARLLQERLLRRARLVGAAAPAERPVTWCLSWDQVTVTAEPLDGVVVYCPATQLDETVIEVLAARSAAALVVAGEAAEPTLAAAAPQLPVVVVEAAITYRELNRLVAELSLARETHVLRFGQTVHRSLAELLYRGAGLEALCHRMTRLTGCGVAIMDAQRHILAFVPSSREESRADGVAGALGDRLPDVPEQSPEHGCPEHGPSVEEIEVNGTATTCVAQPIVLGGRHDGWVALVESTQPPHPHDIAEHRVVVEQAVTIVGTEMLRIRGIEEARERARGDFVHALLHGRFSGPHELEARASHYEFPTGASFGVVVASGLARAGAGDSFTTLSALARDVARIEPVSGIATLATVVGDVLAVVRQVEGGNARDPADAGESALARYARALEKEFERRSGRAVAVAYGRPVDSAGTIFDSYREARIALALRKRLGLDSVCGFHELRVYATLSEVATSERGRAFAEDLLTPLRSNRSGAGDLERSVLAYLSCGGNVNAAARTLHVHRNTMLYKLERASKLLHLDLREAENQFALWLAYKIDMLAELTAAVDRDVTPA